MTRYVNIVFMQGDEGRDVVDKLANVEDIMVRGATAESIAQAVEYLSQWDYGDDDIRDDIGAGSDDTVVEHGGYVLTYNVGLGYVGLLRPIEPPLDADTVFDNYIEAALWSTTDDEGTPLDASYDRDDIDPETLDAMRAEVVDFLDLIRREKLDVSAITPEQFGHDFWLTRNGHGAGFWDRGLGELGDTLTKWAQSYGSVDLYVGDDEKIYAQ